MIFRTHATLLDYLKERSRSKREKKHFLRIKRDECLIFTISFYLGLFAFSILSASVFLAPNPIFLS